MRKPVDIKMKKKMILEDYWLLRGIYTGYNNSKSVVKEQEFSQPPGIEEIANFIAENKDVDFCSVEHNYRLCEPLPFE